jgi:hypothetical protein
MQRIGLRLGQNAGAIKLEDNKIEGFATAVADLRKPADGQEK